MQEKMQVGNFAAVSVIDKGKEYFIVGEIKEVVSDDRGSFAKVNGFWNRWFIKSEIQILELEELPAFMEKENAFEIGATYVTSSDPSDYLDEYQQNGARCFCLYGRKVEVVSVVESYIQVRFGLYDLDEAYVPISMLRKETDLDAYVEPENRFYTCERCGTWSLREENEEDTMCGEDYSLCPECRKRHYITPYHRYDPHLTFWREDGDDDLFLGVELEVDKGGEFDSTAEKIVKMMNPGDGKWFMYCSHDGSLDNGLEMITCPATLNYHLEMADKYKKLFAYLIGKGYRSHNTSTCGLHVHFSRSFYAEDEEENICKLLYLIEKFWDEIVIFSRRDYRSLEHYAKKPEHGGKEFVSRWNKSGCHDGHYYSVNISNANTIELRMFRGTMNLETYLATLEFVDAIVRAAKAHTSAELQQISFEEILGDRALSYYTARKSFWKFEENENDS